MFIHLTDEQTELRNTLGELFAESCPTSLVRAVKEQTHDGNPTRLWRTLAQSGLLGLAVDPEYGGEGAGLFELGLFFQEAGRVLCPTVVYSAAEFGLALSRLGSTAHKKEFLPQLAAGDLRASVAVCNAQDPADVRPSLVAEKTATGWALSGTLSFVSNAAIADVILVTARTAGFAELGRTLGFLVTSGSPGLTAAALLTMAGDKQSILEFDRVAVSDEHVIDGVTGNGLADDDLRWVSFAAIALQCAEMVGGAMAVLDQTVEHLKTREQFGRPLGSFQAAQHHVANMRIAIEAARLTAWQAVWWFGHGDYAARATAIAKMQCNEAYKFCTLTAHQLHAGMGYVLETDLHLWSERAKVAEARGGTSDIAAQWLQTALGLASR